MVRIGNNIIITTKNGILEQVYKDKDVLMVGFSIDEDNTIQMFLAGEHIIPGKEQELEEKFENNDVLVVTSDLNVIYYHYRRQKEFLSMDIDYNKQMLSSIYSRLNVLKQRKNKFVGNTTIKIKELNYSSYIIQTKEDVYTSTVVPYNYKDRVFTIDYDIPLDMYLVDVKIKGNNLFLLKSSRDVCGYVNFYTKKLYDYNIKQGLPVRLFLQFEKSPYGGVYYILIGKVDPKQPKTVNFNIFDIEIMNKNGEALIKNLKLDMLTQTVSDKQIKKEQDFLMEYFKYRQLFMKNKSLDEIINTVIKEIENGEQYIFINDDYYLRQLFEQFTIETYFSTPVAVREIIVENDNCEHLYMVYQIMDTSLFVI